MRECNHRSALNFPSSITVSTLWEKAREKGGRRQADPGRGSDTSKTLGDRALDDGSDLATAKAALGQALGQGDDVKKVDVRVHRY